MNTETYIQISEESLKSCKIIHPPEILEEDKNIIKEYVNIVRDFTEIGQLFNIFLFNFEELKSVFILKGDDKLQKIRYRKCNFDDLTIINSLTINYISSGVAFVKSLEAYLKNNMKNGEYDKFKVNCLSKKYDNCFSYRLFDFLRNFSQHCHLIVSCDNCGYCFDLNQLVNNPYYNYKKLILNEMNDFIRELLYSLGEYPRIAYSRTISEYKLCLSEIYLEFLNIINENLIEKYNEINKILENKPEIINKSVYSEFNDTIIYEIKEDKVELFKIGGNFFKFFYEIKKEVEKEQEKDMKDFYNIDKFFKYSEKFPRLKDGKCIKMNNV